MVNFFKSFGKGILYLFVLPALLVGVAIYGVVALFIFLFLTIKGLVLFFSGRSLYDDLPEDEEAKRRLNPQANRSVQVTTTPEQDNKQVQTNSVIFGPTQNEQPTNIDNDPFYVPEYLKSTPEEKEETPVEDSKQEQVQNSFEPAQNLEPEIEPYSEPEQAPVIEEEKEEDIPLFETSIEQETIDEEPQNLKQDEVIFEKKPSQNTTILDINDIEDDDEDEDKSSGIDIEFH